MKLLKQFWQLFATGIVIILIIGSSWIYYRYQNVKNSTIDNLQQPVSSLIISINPSTLEKLKASSEDLNSADYLYMRDQFKKFEGVYEKDGVLGFYAMRSDGAEMRFLVDSADENDPWHSEPGVIYEQPTERDFQIFKDGKAFFEGPTTDEYGTFYSFLAPINNSSGKIIGVMGADIDAVAFNKVLIHDQLFPAIEIILFVFLYLLIILLISRRFESVFLARENEVLEEKVKAKTKELGSYIESLRKKNQDLQSFNEAVNRREMKINTISKENESLREELGINKSE